MSEEQRYIDANQLIQDLIKAQPANPQASDYVHGITVGLAMAVQAVEDQEDVLLPREISWERAQEVKAVIDGMSNPEYGKKIAENPNSFIVPALLDIGLSLAVIADTLQTFSVPVAGEDVIDC